MVTGSNDGNVNTLAKIVDPVALTADALESMQDPSKPFRASSSQNGTPSDSQIQPLTRSMLTKWVLLPSFCDREGSVTNCQHRQRRCQSRHSTPEARINNSPPNALADPARHLHFYPSTKHDMCSPPKQFDKLFEYKSVSSKQWSGLRGEIYSGNLSFSD